MKILFPAILSLAIVIQLPAAAKPEAVEARLAAERRDAPILEQAIVAAEEITLLSIVPDSRYEEQKKDRRYVMIDDMEGSWTISGEVRLSDKKIMAELARSLRNGIEEDSDYGPPPCFRPRHAIQFRRGETVVTVLICFECAQCYTHGFKERQSFQVSAAPEVTWTRVFTTAGLKIAK
jgi:hypothetical protein